MTFFLFRTCSKFLRRYRDRKTGNILRALGRTWVPRKKRKKNVPEKSDEFTYWCCVFFSSYRISSPSVSNKRKRKTSPHSYFPSLFFIFPLFSIFIWATERRKKRRAFLPCTTTVCSIEVPSLSYLLFLFLSRRYNSLFCV